MLHGYGTANRDANKCEYLKMGVREFIIELRVWKNELGITHIRFVTSDGRSLDKGVSVGGLPSNSGKSFLFDETHRLVGFKGLTNDAGIFSLGTILLDSTCDINDPMGLKKPVEREIIEVDQPFFESEGGKITIGLIVVAAVLLILLILVVCLMRRRKHEPKDAKDKDQELPVWASGLDQDMT